MAGAEVLTDRLVRVRPLCLNVGGLDVDGGLGQPSSYEQVLGARALLGEVVALGLRRQRVRVDGGLCLARSAPVLSGP